MKKFLKISFTIVPIMLLFFSCEMTNSRSFVCEDGTRITITDNNNTYILKFKEGYIYARLINIDHGVFTYTGIEIINGDSIKCMIVTFRDIKEMMNKGISYAREYNFIEVTVNDYNYDKSNLPKLIGDYFINH